MEDKEIKVVMEQVKDFEFLVKFDQGTELLMDEPEPLGSDSGPSASKVLSAAIGNCLSASLLFCLQKARVNTHGIKTTVTTQMTRNEKRRLRIGASNVKIEIDLDLADAPTRAGRCIELFEDFCIVTGSIRNGIDVDVEVVDRSGMVLYQSSK